MPRAARSLAGTASKLADAAVPRLPLPAVLGFAAMGLGGAFFLAFSTFQTADGISSHRLPAEVPVYSARAVPHDPEDSVIAMKLLALAQQQEMARKNAGRGEKSGETPSDPLSSDGNAESPGFSRLSRFAASNTYLALAAANLAVGISAQTNPSGHQAPDAETETLSMVPEPSTWMCGLGLLVLVGARCVRANWRRHRAFRERALLAG